MDAGSIQIGDCAPSVPAEVSTLKAHFERRATDLAAELAAAEARATALEQELREAQVRCAPWFDRPPQSSTRPHLHRRPTAVRNSGAVACSSRQPSTPPCRALPVPSAAQT